MSDRKTRKPATGQVVTLLHESNCLQDNPLGDPTERVLPVYLPPQYHNPRNRHRRYPVLFELAAFTNSGPGRVTWRNFELSLPERIDQLIARRQMPPAIVVFPDCFTTLGGNQYLNSSAIGPYADYLTTELVPFIDKELRTLATRDHRGCLGKSSGGYGALLHLMKYPKIWGAAASHAGDAYFDFVYRAEWPSVLTHLQQWQPKNNPEKPSSRGFDDGRVAAFLEYRQNAKQLSGMDITTLMLLCMAATYDPDQQAPNGFKLPFDLHTGELLPSRWKQWLAHDPVRLVSRYQRTLRKARALHIDCGWRDQYHIHFGARQLHRALETANVPHHYEEFDGTHSGIDYRLDTSLPRLARALS